MQCKIGPRLPRCALHGAPLIALSFLSAHYANTPYAIAFQHLTRAPFEWWKAVCLKRKDTPTWMMYVMPNVVRTNMVLTIREQISENSTAQQWFVAAMELYQVENTI